MPGKTTEANHCTRSLAGNSCSNYYICFSCLRGQKEGGFCFKSKSCLHIWEAKSRPHGQQQMGTGWEQRGKRTGSQQEKQAPETIQSPETPLLSSHAKAGARPEASRPAQGSRGTTRLCSLTLYMIMPFFLGWALKGFWWLEETQHQGSVAQQINPGAMGHSLSRVNGIRGPA